MKTTADPTQIGSRLEASLARERNEERESPDELWTLVVTNTLVERLPLLPRPPTPEASGEALPEAQHAQSSSLSGAPPADEPSTTEGSVGRSGQGRVGERGSATNSTSVLCAEVSDERLGRLALRVVRGQGGLDIVIGVADAHVKALIMAEQGALMSALKDAGLAVVSVQIGASTQIGSPSRAGTGLAVEGMGARTGAERPRAAATFRQPGARWRGYQGSREDEDDDAGEGVDFTA